MRQHLFNIHTELTLALGFGKGFNYAAPVKADLYHFEPMADIEALDNTKEYNTRFSGIRGRFRI